MIHEGNILQNIDIKEYTNTIQELKEDKFQLQNQTQQTQVQLDQNSSIHLQELFKQKENYENIIKDLQDQIKVHQTNIRDINKQLFKENQDFNKVIAQQQDEIKRLLSQNQTLIRLNSSNDQKIKQDKEQFEKTLKEQKLKFQKKVQQQQKEFEEQVESQKQQNDILIKMQEDKTLKEIKQLNQQLSEWKQQLEEVSKQLLEERNKFVQLESILDSTNKDLSSLKTKYHSDILYRQVMIGNAEKKQIQYEKDLTHYKELYLSLKEKYQLQENNYQQQIRKLNEGTINLRVEIDKLMQMIQNQEEQYQSLYNCLNKHIKFNDEPTNDQINKYISRQQAQLNLLNSQIKQLEETLNQKSYQENINKKQIENQNFEIVRLQKQVWEQKEMIHAYEMANLKQSQLMNQTDINIQEAKENEKAEYQDFSQQYRVPNIDKSVGQQEPEKQQQQKQQQQQEHDVMLEKHPYYSIFNNQRPKSKRNSLLQVPPVSSSVLQDDKNQTKQSLQVSYTNELRKKSDEMQVSIQENNSVQDDLLSIKNISIQTSQIWQNQNQIELPKEDKESQISIFMIDRRLSCHIMQENVQEVGCQTEGNLQQIANQHYLRKIVELENDYESLNKTYKMQLQQDYVKNMKLILNKQTQSDVSYSKSNHTGSQTENLQLIQNFNQVTIESQQKLRFDDQLTNVKTAQDTIELKLNRPILLDVATQTKVFIKSTSTDEQQRKDEQIQKANSLLVEKGKLELQIENKDRQLLELQEQIQIQNQLINQQKQSLRSHKKNQIQNTTNPNLNPSNKHNRETQTVLIDLEIMLLEQEKQLYQANHIIKYLNLELENYKQNYSLFSNCKEFQRIKPLELKQINTKRNDSSVSQYQQSPRSTILPVLDEQPSSNRNSSSKKYRQRNRSLFTNPFDQEIMKNAYKLVNSLKDPVKV